MHFNSVELPGRCTIGTNKPNACKKLAIEIATKVADLNRKNMPHK